MTNAEKIAALAETIESDARKSMVAEMIAELIEFAPTDSDTREGWMQAVEFLKENFS